MRQNISKHSEEFLKILCLLPQVTAFTLQTTTSLLTYKHDKLSFQSYDEGDEVALLLIEMN